MNAEQILLNFTDTKPDSPMAGVYVLCGFAARRITAAAQQHRAISLVEALVACRKLKGGTSVGILGGGLTGSTLAYWAVCNGARVTVYEKESRLLTAYSKATHRFLHPGLFNWPHPGWNVEATNLPCMNWEFGRANDIENQLRAKVEALQKEVGEPAFRVVPNDASWRLKAEMGCARLGW